ncbi:hypothetical protein [Erwinia persicina]|uniref:hypothetical protein n=1 Tax=Erwinia persicina TaxID=55211 RepID=UPI0039AF3B41
MASTNKLTMYYRDETTRLFLEEKSQQFEGKKSGSRYLYSLVERERKNADTLTLDSSNKAWNPLTSIYPVYLGGQEYETRGWVKFPSIERVSAYFRQSQMEGGKFSIKREDLKTLREGIISEIIEDYYKKTAEFSVAGKQDNENFTVIVINHIRCHYHDFDRDGMLYGEFLAEWKFIDVNQALWDKYEGGYDFSKIKYCKYRKILGFNEGRGFSMIHETSLRDSAGAYFIPVREDSLPFKVPNKGKKGPIIIGGSIDQNDARTYIKKMNETRIKAIKSKNKKLGVRGHV